MEACLGYVSVKEVIFHDSNIIKKSDIKKISGWGGWFSGVVATQRAAPVELLLPAVVFKRQQLPACQHPREWGSVPGCLPYCMDGPDHTHCGGIADSGGCCLDMLAVPSLCFSKAWGVTAGLLMGMTQNTSLALPYVCCWSLCIWWPKLVNLRLAWKNNASWTFSRALGDCFKEEVRGSVLQSYLWDSRSERKEPVETNASPFVWRLLRQLESWCHISFCRMRTSCRLTLLFSHSCLSVLVRTSLLSSHLQDFCTYNLYYPLVMPFSNQSLKSSFRWKGIV